MTFLRDLRFGLRVLARNRMFAAAALGVMTLGIGATTTRQPHVPGIMRSVKAASITDSFFETLCVAPMLGRSVSHVDHGSQFMNGVNISYGTGPRARGDCPRRVGGHLTDERANYLGG
jgi:hypothetical protein